MFLSSCLTLVFAQLVIGREKVGECDCKNHEFYPEAIQRKLDVRCDDLTTPQHFSCFKDYLDGLPLDDGLVLRITTKDTKLDLMSKELLNGHPVTSLTCYFCTLSQIAYGDLCSKTLRSLTLHIEGNDNSGLELSSGGFKSCPLLNFLGLRGNDITVVPPDSFQGLNSLVELDLSNNMIQSTPQFSGIENTLEILDLSNNSIGSIGNDAFRGMSKLRILYLRNSKIVAIQDSAFTALPPNCHVFLAGNPFDCDCSLKWLPQWFEGHLNRTGFESWGAEEDVNPNCATPFKGPLRTMEFCNSTSPSSDLTEMHEGWTTNVVFLLRFILLGF